MRSAIRWDVQGFTGQVKEPGREVLGIDTVNWLVFCMCQLLQDDHVSFLVFNRKLKSLTVFLSENGILGISKFKKIDWCNPL